MIIVKQNLIHELKGVVNHSMADCLMSKRTLTPSTTTATLHPDQTVNCKVNKQKTRDMSSSMILLT